MRITVYFMSPQEWGKILQPNFQHSIDWSTYDYQIAFDLPRQLVATE
ncbi:colicin E3-like toxin immunity protein [Pseudomonas citrulli]